MSKLYQLVKIKLNKGTEVPNEVTTALAEQVAIEDMKKSKDYKVNLKKYDFSQSATG